MRQTEKLGEWWKWIKNNTSKVILTVCMYLGQTEEEDW